MKDRKVGVGWNRRREQGNEAYPLRTDVGGVGADIEKSLLGLDSRAGTKKVGFREGGHDTHTDTQTYIYIYKYIHIVRYMYKYQVMGFARQRVTGGSTLLQRGWG